MVNDMMYLFAMKKRTECRAVKKVGGLQQPMGECLIMQKLVINIAIAAQLLV